MRRMFLGAALLGVFWANPSPVSAEPIVIFASRTSLAGAQVGGTFTEDIDRNADVLISGASVADEQNAATAEAVFISTLPSGPDTWLASGRGTLNNSITASTGSAVAYSSGSLFLTFSIDEPYRYSFFAGLGRSEVGVQVVEATLFTGGTSIFDYRLEDAGFQQAGGILLPGQYDFFFVGRTTVGCGFSGPEDCTFLQAIGSIAFDLELSAQDAPIVPEPGTMILLGSGLAGVLAARRRRTAVPQR